MNFKTDSNKGERMASPRLKTVLLGLAVCLSSCGEKPPAGSSAVPAPSPSPAVHEKAAPGALPAAEAGNAGNGQKSASGATPGREKAPSLAGVVLPDKAETGQVPAGWGGRTAAQEEKRLRDAGLWTEGRAGFFEKWAEEDPAAAIKASRRTDPDSLTISTAAAVTGWARADRAAAKAWINSQPENAERGIFVKALLEAEDAGKLPKSDPADLAAWLGAQLKVPGIQSPVTSFVSSWSAVDRDAASSWTAETVQDPALRTRIYSTLIHEAVSGGDGGNTDSYPATAQWLQGRPEGPAKDELLLAFVKEAANHDPATSANWAALIKDEALRASALKICADAGQVKASTPR